MSEEIQNDQTLRDAIAIADAAPGVLDQLMVRMTEVGDCSAGFPRLLGQRVLHDLLGRLDLLKQAALVCTNEVHMHCVAEHRMEWVVARDRIESSIQRAHLMMHDFVDRLGVES